MVNVDKFFDIVTLDRIKKKCFREDFCPPQKIQGLCEILEHFQQEAETYIGTKHVDYEDLAKAKPRPDEHTILKLLSGEIPSRATKHQSVNLGLDLGIELSKRSGGRKLDLQCRVGDQELEISNSEFKRCFSAPSKLDEQYPKNVLINHAMMLYLSEAIGKHCVHGLTSRR
ncbi:hypothetical protein BGX34_011256 [Mortierella sp. NVP85]|nr:hypothetical protein BGX34_011256 [Mortierella sp. NVP85]